MQAEPETDWGKFWRSSQRDADRSIALR